MTPESANPDLGFIGRIADRLGDGTGARTVFGDPIERDGVTVIPVAKARWGFGGGMGSGKGDEEGGGGGGGVSVSPLGYIEVRDRKAQFRPIYDPALLLPLVLVGGTLFLLFLRKLRKLVR